MNGVDPKSANYAINKIDDGNVFETFAKDFLSKLLGYNFIPIGGMHDKGIDGLERTFYESDKKKTIYQLSIQKTYKSKITASLDKLKLNKTRYKPSMTSRRFGEGALPRHANMRL